MSNQQEDFTTGYPGQIRQDKGKLGVSMLGLDLGSWGHVILPGVFTLGVLALIIMVLVLGVVALYSWEAESLIHCSPWSTPSSPCGQMF
jgi:hypothetical protein